MSEGGPALDKGMRKMRRSPQPRAVQETEHEGTSSACRRGKAGKGGVEIFSSKRLHLSYFLPSPAINLKGDITAN